MLALPCAAQTNALSFEPIAAQYSKALDRIIMISAGSSNLLHIYNPSTNADATVTLPDVPLNFSVSPDGLHAAVAHSNSVSYVNLQAASVEQVFSVQVGTGVVVLSSTYIYVMPIYEGTPVSIDISTGAQTNYPSFLLASGAYVDAGNGQMYGTEGGVDPDDIEHYNISVGPITAPPAQGASDVCSPLWFSPDGTKIYNRCSGTVLQSSTNTSQDMTYVSVIPGLNGIEWMDQSDSIQRVAAIPWNSQLDSEVLLFDSSYYNQVGSLTLAPFSVSGETFTAHGKYVFFKSDGSSLYVLAQADSTSGLLYDYEVQTVALANPTACNGTLSASSAEIAGSGSMATVDITAGTGCLFQASSGVPWIQLVSGYYGSGNTTMTYLVRPNTSSQSRTGSITVAGQTLSVTQDPAVAPSSINNLSVNVAQADYSKALDSIVFTVAGPNELHIYNPVTLSDQVVPLVSAPLSVSVSPDGQYAAVGHAGWISYVNLSTATVQQVFAIDTDASGIILAGNGYIYVFSRNQNFGYSLRISDRTWTAVNNLFGGFLPRLYVDDEYLYVAGNETSKWDISQGTLAGTATPFMVGNCGNIWLTEDGKRMFTACGGVYRTLPVSSEDLAVNGSLPGTSNVTWAAESNQQQATAVIGSSPNTTDSTLLQIYSNNGLALDRQDTVPTFTVNATTYTGHGQFVFWNAAESKLFSVIQADSSAGLMSSYAVFAQDYSGGVVPNCTYAVSPNSVVMSSFGGTAQFAVTASCAWIAGVSDPSWIWAYTGTGAASGPLEVIVDTNSTPTPRSTTVTVGGQVVSIIQSGASCNTSVTPNAVEFPAGGGSNIFNFSFNSDCASNLATSSASWVHVNGTTTAQSNALVSYSVDPNTSSTARTGTISVNNQTFTVSQAGTSTTAAPLLFVPVTPCRIADTRNADGPFGGPIISGGSTRDFPIPTSSCGIPNTAQAYALNVTVVPSAGLGYLTIWPAGQSQPLVSTLNSDGRIKANAAIVPAGQSGAVSVYASNDTHVVLDISGYFVPASANAGLAFYPLMPCRVGDTRLSDALQGLGAPSMTAGESRDFPVLLSSCNIPSTAQAYSVNFTVVPKNGLAYLSTWPAGESKPLVSTLNDFTGTVVANAAIVPAGTAGDISVFATDATDVIIDINGYFAPPAQGGLSLYTISPCRALDTRAELSPQPLCGEMSLDIGIGPCQVTGGQAYVVNATVVPPEPLAYLALWPDGETRPLVSTLNAFDGAVTSNMAIVPASNASIDAFTTSATALVVDVSAYFAP